MALGQVKSTAPSSLEVNGDVTTNPFEMAECMASHYSSKVDEIRARKIPNPRIELAQRLRVALDRRLSERNNLTKMDLKPVSQTQLRNTIKRHKGGRALGGDSIDGFLLKTASRVLLPALTHLVNLSIKERTFLERWKFHVVLPHHKKGSKEEPDN